MGVIVAVHVKVCSKVFNGHLFNCSGLAASFFHLSIVHINVCNILMILITYLNVLLGAVIYRISSLRRVKLQLINLANYH